MQKTPSSRYFKPHSLRRPGPLYPGLRVVGNWCTCCNDARRHDVWSLSASQRATSCHACGRHTSFGVAKGKQFQAICMCGVCP